MNKDQSKFSITRKIKNFINKFFGKREFENRVDDLLEFTPLYIPKALPLKIDEN